MLAACWSCGTCSNFTSSASSVYQPGLRWPPRILTVNFQVTRGHDGHSGVGRPVWSSHENPWREALPDPPGPKGLQPRFSFFVSLISFVFFCFFLTYAHIQLCLNQNLTIRLACGQVCAVKPLHVFDSNESQIYGNTEFRVPFNWPGDMTGDVGDDLRAPRSSCYWSGL